MVLSEPVSIFATMCCSSTLWFGREREKRSRLDASRSFELDLFLSSLSNPGKRF